MTYRFLKCWVDGGVLRSNPSPYGVYWSVIIEGGPIPIHINRMRSRDYSTNADAEWLAVRCAIHRCVTMGLNQPVVIYSDSDSVVKQFNGTYQVQVPQHQKLYAECKELAEKLPWVALRWVPREKIVAKLGH